jgi:hypothetical protein
MFLVQEPRYRRAAESVKYRRDARDEFVTSFPRAIARNSCLSSSVL